MIVENIIFSCVENSFNFFFLLLLKVKNGNSKNNIPPGRILDLRAAAVDSMDPSSGVTITFTAPGDDLDEGKGL